MSLYTTDIDRIYSAIRDGNVKYETVRILSSPLPHSIDILDDFTNAEQVLCPLVCPLDKVDTLGLKIYNRHKLNSVSFMIFIPITKPNTSSPAMKKRKIHQLTPWERVIKISIPAIIRKIGRRMRYINLAFQIIESDTDLELFVSINKGILYINMEMPLTEKIFHALVETNTLSGIITNGDGDYNLVLERKEICVPEVSILTRCNDECNPINEEYLKDLVGGAEIITLVYTPDTIEERYLYGEILRQGSTGSLKRIRGIITTSEAEALIKTNKYLEEIHILVRNGDDVEDMKYILETYEYRPIAFYIHYCKYNDEEYWTCLKGMGDVIFQDIIRTLM